MNIDPELARKAADSLRTRVKEERMIEQTPEETDLELYAEACKLAAVEFLDKCSIEPKPEAVAQLVEAFLPCLQIIATRHYRQDGAQWRGLGWRGILHEMMKRMQRLEHSSWDNDVFDANAANDMINFTGYYKRLRNQGKPFGNRNDPGSGTK